MRGVFADGSNGGCAKMTDQEKMDSHSWKLTRDLNIRVCDACKLMDIRGHLITKQELAKCMIIPGTPNNYVAKRLPIISCDEFFQIEQMEDILK